MQSGIVPSQSDTEKASLVRVRIRNPVLSLFLSSCSLSGTTAERVDVFVKMMMSEAQDGRQYMREAETVVIFVGVWLLVRFYYCSQAFVHMRCAYEVQFGPWSTDRKMTHFEATQPLWRVICPGQKQVILFVLTF